MLTGRSTWCAGLTHAMLRAAVLYYAVGQNIIIQMSLPPHLHQAQHSRVLVGPVLPGHQAAAKQALAPHLDSTLHGSGEWMVGTLIGWELMLHVGSGLLHPDGS